MVPHFKPPWLHPHLCLTHCTSLCSNGMNPNMPSKSWLSIVLYLVWQMFMEGVTQSQGWMPLWIHDLQVWVNYQTDLVIYLVFQCHPYLELSSPHHLPVCSKSSWEVSCSLPISSPQATTKNFLNLTQSLHFLGKTLSTCLPEFQRP